MKYMFVDFLKDLLELINFANKINQFGEACDEEEYVKIFLQKSAQVKNRYENLKAQGYENNLLIFFKEEYGDDAELYLFLLDYLYRIVGDTKIEVKYMEQRLENAIINSENEFLILNLDMQIRSLAWRNNIEISFDRQWNLNCFLGDKIKERIGFCCEKIPISNRDKNVIVVVASQILGIKHAPTRLAFDICYRMRKYLNKDILLLNLAQCTDKYILQKAGVSFASNYNIYQEYNGQKDIEYRDIVIPIYQVPMEENNLYEIKSVLEFIYELKPYCIWNVATLPAMMSVLNQITTNVYTSCTAGYAPVKTDIFYNYFPNTSKGSNNKAYLEQRGTKIVDSVFIGKKHEFITNISKKDLGIAEDSFVICVAGNRLESEINDTYLEIINTIMKSNQQVHLMIIGEISEEFEKYCTNRIKFGSKVYFMGYRQDFVECMSVMDLYVNAFGLGSGNAGNNALFLGKPIVTMNEGDIYAFAGEEFAVESVEGYIPLINRYINDKAFYRRQSICARERYEKLAADDKQLAMVLQGILDEIN